MLTTAQPRKTAMFFKIRSIYATAALSAVLTVAAVASAKYKAGSPQIVFHAKGAGGLAIDGKSSKLMISEDDKTVTFKTFLNTMDTGIGKRNEHMQERFEADKFPDITLSVPKDKIDDKGGGSVPGTLTLHGVSKPVTVNYKVSDKHVKADFAFNVKNHGIDDKKLCAFSVCARPDVTVEVNFDIKE
jgi:polyisoprenoid-binding protein YceI